MSEHDSICAYPLTSDERRELTLLELTHLIASELGVSVTALRRWVRYHREGYSDTAMKPEDPIDPAKYKAMEARMRELQRENDFLKKFRRMRLIGVK